MHNQVFSEMLSDKRLEWQDSTIAAMQKSLNAHPTGSYSVSEYDRSLVVIYGNTQIGKTSLILHIMGVLPEYQREVYRVLRAGQEYGDSSTITAVFYHVSGTDFYGISASDAHYEDNPINLTDEEMILRLAQIRREIENGKKSYQLLHIFIPFKYFSKDVLENESFSIMDLPGINSKNRSEQSHVDLVVAKYMSLATARIIVTKGDSIQDLESIEVPEKIDWRAFPNRYFIVVTMAFSQGNIKKYFMTRKSDRKTSFIKHIENAYAEIPRIISSEEVEWYPVDVGESFRNLLHDFKEDSEELIYTQDHYVRKIRAAIAKRKGNGLINIIKDLDTFSRDYYRVNIGRISEKIAQIDRDIQIKRNQFKTASSLRQKYQNEVSKYTAEQISEFTMIDNLDCSKISNNVAADIDTFIKKIETEYPSQFHDREKKIINKYLKMVAASAGKYSDVRQCIGEKLYYRIFPDGIDIRLSQEGTVSGVPEDLCSELNLTIRNQLATLDHMLRPRGMQSYFKKVKRTDVTTTLSQMSTAWKYTIENSLSNDISRVFSQIKAERYVYYLKKHLLERKASEAEEIQNYLQLAQKDQKEEKRKLRDWKQKEKTDDRLIEEYLKIAKTEYQRSKAKIRKEMAACPMAERIQYLIILGLMEQDFNLLMETK